MSQNPDPSSLPHPDAQIYMYLSPNKCSRSWFLSLPMVNSFVSLFVISKALRFKSLSFLLPVVLDLTNNIVGQSCRHNTCQEGVFFTCFYRLHSSPFLYGCCMRHKSCSTPQVECHSGAKWVCFCRHLYDRPKRRKVYTAVNTSKLYPCLITIRLVESRDSLNRTCLTKWNTSSLELKKSEEKSESYI